MFRVAGSARALRALILTGMWLATGVASWADDTERRPVDLEPVGGEIQVGAPVTPTRFDGDVRNLPAPRTWKPGDPIRDIPQRFFTPDGRPDAPTPQLDPLVQRQIDATPRALEGETFTTPTHNFAGQGFTGVNPPDTVGDVGPDHFIQAINSANGAVIRIYDKTAPVPGVLATFLLDTLGSGLCGSGFGDPIVLYDRQAERWVLTEFAGGANALCVYVSQTGDPVSGGWFAYQFVTPTFPDYPKYAVWATDANGGDGSYIVTANDGGPGAYALNRGPMLVGDPSTFIRFGMPRLNGFGVQGPAPADPDGPLGPPSGEPAIIMRHRDTESHGGSAAGDVLELWRLQVDWQNTSNSSLVLESNVDVADFDSNLCGLTTLFCFEQPTPGATTLMPLREVIHNRLQYYNHGDRETLVGNFTVDVDGTDRGGLRWFELRRDPAGSWSTFQEGTFSPDAADRWIGASAMDQSGNIALAYNVVSPVIFPSLRYTGRLSEDPAGVMSQPETLLHAGTASNSSNRYGDYAAMGLDPTDDCTFWFTGMDNTSGTWRTQVSAFRFTQCGCLVQPAAPAVSAETLRDNEVDLFWPDSELDTVVEYTLLRSRTPGGPYETIAILEDSSPGFADGPGYSFVDTDVSADVTYYYAVSANDGGPCFSEGANETAVIPIGVCNQRPDFVGLETIGSSVEDTCAVRLDWSEAAVSCGGPLTYNVYRSTDPGFTPGPDTLLASGVTGTSLSDVNDLAISTDYFYAVRAVDQSTGIEEPNSVVLSVPVAGPGSGLQQPIAASWDLSAELDAWTVDTGPEHRCGEWVRTNSNAQRPATGSGFYIASVSQECNELLPRTNTTLTSPAIDLSSPFVRTVELRLDVFYNHNGGETATIEAFDGSQWVTLWTDPDADVNQRLSFDVTDLAIGNSQFRVRLHYTDANNDRWFSADNIIVEADVLAPCTTSNTPAALPDGSSGEPVRADRLSPSGDTLGLSWSTTCARERTHLLFGGLDDVSQVEIDGGVCDLGSTGTFTWSGVPDDSVFFLLVGADSTGVESSWGTGVFGQRGGLTPSGQCGARFKNVVGVCE